MPASVDSTQYHTETLADFHNRNISGDILNEDPALRIEFDNGRFFIDKIDLFSIGELKKEFKERGLPFPIPIVTMPGFVIMKPKTIKPKGISGLHLPEGSRPENLVDYYSEHPAQGVIVASYLVSHEDAQRNYDFVGATALLKTLVGDPVLWDGQEYKVVSISIIAGLV